MVKKLPEKESLPEKKEESFFSSVIKKIKRVQRPEKTTKKVPRDRSKR
ncbi:hypothetical protein MOC98_09830, partial [Bacillus spizizenii]|nr:hypothetical protein [Bacillus spizizenii]